MKNKGTCKMPEQNKQTNKQTNKQQTNRPTEKQSKMLSIHFFQDQKRHLL